MQNGLSGKARAILASAALLIAALMPAHGQSAMGQQPVKEQPEKIPLNCYPILSAWNGFMHTKSMILFAQTDDGSKQVKSIVVDSWAYGLADGKWQKSTFGVFARSILFHHGIGAIDPESCEFKGELYVEGEMLAVYGHRSSHVHAARGEYDQVEILIDDKGRLRRWKRDSWVQSITYDNVVAPVVE
jgi:hypothetical protein